ncbi:uncharacterized protein BT62DRAFT_127635 [Guyanagaster necrorhizus]|uniref:Uncharacterized protein n=1 Tax=Guyanagaster necrorhizus TaxID=856835 RepID=A0A9P8AT37_9AGAR|nr:uncharacterized protein BT62DRAFT_127635 [Guyanagaster necrorhizus MCA 3950]KAG7446571.1 hypothetical protein BT62DRAFT_127635 [Guyanagaster necrorhizus MCA 3950]
MENSTLPAPTFTEFKFRDIGRAPALLHRFTSTHLGGIEHSPSPSPPPEEHAGAPSPSVSISRPTLMQVLGTCSSDVDVAGVAASTSGDTIPGLALQPSPSITPEAVPSVPTSSIDNALLNTSEWQLRYPSSEPPKSDPHTTHPSSTPLPAPTTDAVRATSHDSESQAENSLATLIKLKDQLLSSLAFYTPPNPSTVFLLAKASCEQSSAALDAAQRAHTLAQQLLSSVQESVNVAQEALCAAERAHSLAEDATVAMEKLKTDNEPWKVLEETIRSEIASLDQWIMSEKSRLLAETRRLANSARNLDSGNNASRKTLFAPRATQLSRDFVNSFEPLPDSDVVMGSPDDHNVQLHHDEPVAPDDGLRRRQEIQCRLDEEMAAAEAKRVEDEVRDVALRKDEEERLKRVKDAELAARRAREEEEAEILRAREQRDKEKKQQAEDTEARRAAQKKERREAEEALANRSREVERRRALELKRHQDLLAEQKKQREEVQRAKMQYNRVQAARINAERAKGPSTDNVTSSPPPPHTSSAIQQSNGLPHPSASEAISMNAAPIILSSQPQVSSIPSSSLPMRRPATSPAPASTQIGSTGVQQIVDVALPVQAVKELPEKGNRQAHSGDVKLGTISTPSTDPPPSLIHTTSLGLRPRVPATSPVPSTLPPTDAIRMTHTFPSMPNSKVLSTASTIIDSHTGTFASQKPTSADKHSVPPIDHLPQTPLSPPDSETMVPCFSSDNGNVPIVKMEDMDELFHVQEANIRHIRERSRVDASQMARIEEVSRQSINTVSQPPKIADAVSVFSPPVQNSLPLNAVPVSTLPPSFGSIRTPDVLASQKIAAQMPVNPVESMPAAAPNPPTLFRKPQKGKASKASPADQISSQPSRGDQKASSKNESMPPTNPKVASAPINQKAPAKEQAPVAAASCPSPNAAPAAKPSTQKKTPTKPRSASPLTVQTDHGRATHIQSSYQSGPSTSRAPEPRGPSPMGPAGFPSDSGWHSARPVDENAAHERRSYESDRYPSSSHRRGCFSPAQDYPNESSSNSYDRRYDHYSPPPPPSPRGGFMSPMPRSLSPTPGMKRRREDSAFIRNRRQRQDVDPYSREPRLRARGVPPRPQTPPAAWNRDISPPSPPPTLVSRLGVNAGDPAVADYDYSAVTTYPSTYSYKTSRRPDSLPPRSSNDSKNPQLLGRLSNVFGKPPPSQPMRGRRGRGGNPKPCLAARIGNAGINDSY